MAGRQARWQAMADFASFHDPLTGLPNRAAVSVLLADILLREDDVAVVAFGVEHMTRVSDVHGPTAASEVLRVVAARIRLSLPVSATLGRLGGDVFVALIPGANAAFAPILAWQAIERVREPMFIAGRQLQPTLDAGIARRLPNDGVERLLRDAGLTLRRAQVRGGGRVEVFETEASAGEDAP